MGWVMVGLGSAGHPPPGRDPLITLHKKPKAGKHFKNPSKPTGHTTPMGVAMKKKEGGANR